MIVGGHFTTLNGGAANGTGAIDAVSGATLPWAASSVVWASGVDGAIMDLRLQGTSVYGNGYTYGREYGNLEGTFKANVDTGAIEWVEDCHGDTYQIAPVNGYVYTASHAHFCGNVGGYPQSDDPWAQYMRRALSFKDAVAGTLRRENWSYYNLEGLPAPSLVSWFPDFAVGTFTGQGQAAWAVDANVDYTVYGGEFTRINSLQQQGLVRFAVRVPSRPEGVARSSEAPRSRSRSSRPQPARCASRFPPTGTGTTACSTIGSHATDRPFTRRPWHRPSGTSPR